MAFMAKDHNNCCSLINERMTYNIVRQCYYMLIYHFKNTIYSYIGKPDIIHRTLTVIFNLAANIQKYYFQTSFF